VLGWSGDLCHRVRMQHCPGDVNILGRKPNKTIAVCDVYTRVSLTIAVHSILLTMSGAGRREPGQTLHKRDKNTWIACHGML
jgi:hypothetical protein